MTELERIAAALERLAPQPLPPPNFAAAEAFVWHTAPDRLDPVAKVSRVDVSLLLGIDRSRDTLMDAVYADNRVVTDRTVDTHVKNVRRKIEAIRPGDTSIRSIYGAGYRLDL